MMMSICHKKRARHAGACPKAFALLRSGTLKEPTTGLPLIFRLAITEKDVKGRGLNGYVQ